MAMVCTNPLMVVKLGKILGWKKPVIFQTSPFNEHLKAEVMPGPLCQSDDEMTDYLLQQVQSMYHPVGTCKMGSDGMSVVDHRLRVKGIKGLRIADASIMPCIPSGNTNAPVIMIADKAAAMMLQDDH